MDASFPSLYGIPMFKGFSVKVFSSAVEYSPKPGDIFVASYPKCGTTWLQTIVLLILRDGKPNDPEDTFFDCPYLELSGMEALDNVPKPLAIKTHLPRHLAPFSNHAKYIYICRSPKDCAVSYYYHLKDRKDYTFDEFYELFTCGEVPYGDVLDHFIGWYKHKDEPNVHLVTYEHLKMDPRSEILKIAKFIGEDYWELLQKESSILDDVVHYSSFDYMKKGVNEVMSRFWKGEINARGRVIPSPLKERLEWNKRIPNLHFHKENFLRKGIVGDWKNHFNSEQSCRYDAKIAEKGISEDIAMLWE